MRSVVMTTYNGIAYVRHQLESILGQMAEDDELIISDNGSTDGTWEYLQQMDQSDQRIVLLSFTKEQGIIANFNYALSYCNGDLIFLADQDDIWLPDKMRVMTERFESNPELLVVQVNAEMIDSSGNIIGKDFFSYRSCGAGFWKNFCKNTWQGCNMAFHRDLLFMAWPIPKFVPMHDVWLGLLADLSGEVEFIPEILAQYRRHDTNLSDLRPSGPWRVVLWRVQLMVALFSRFFEMKKFKRSGKTVDSTGNHF